MSQESRGALQSQADAPRQTRQRLQQVLAAPSIWAPANPRAPGVRGALGKPVWDGLLRPQVLPSVFLCCLQGISTDHRAHGVGSAPEVCSTEAT